MDQFSEGSEIIDFAGTGGPKSVFELISAKLIQIRGPRPPAVLPASAGRTAESDNSCQKRWVMFKGSEIVDVGVLGGPLPRNISQDSISFI